MKCVASMKRSQVFKMKKNIVDNALEFVLTVTCYVLITQFHMSVEKTQWILQRIEYNALILNDKEDMTFEDYEGILKDEYNFSLDLSKVKRDVAKTKTDVIKQLATYNAMCYALTMVAYVLFDKIGLNKKRAETIIKRILFYVNRALRNDAELEKYKEILKQNYDCEINVTGR